MISKIGVNSYIPAFGVVSKRAEKWAAETVDYKTEEGKADLKWLVNDSAQNAPDFTVKCRYYGLFKKCFKVVNNKTGEVANSYIPDFEVACKFAIKAQEEKNENEEYERKNGNEIVALINEIYKIDGIDKNIKTAAINSAGRNLENLKEVKEHIAGLKNVPDFKIKCVPRNFLSRLLGGEKIYLVVNKLTGEVVESGIRSFEQACKAAQEAQAETK